MTLSGFFRITKNLSNDFISNIQNRINKFKAYQNFINDFKSFKDQSKKEKRFKLLWKYRRPFLNEKTPVTGFDAHYIYHTAWAARMLVKTKPKKHVDIGSRIFFSTITSAFIPIDFYDLRPLKIELDNLKCKKADLLSLPFKTNSVDSLSCMHTIEHVGLGRYGDELNPTGDLKAIDELKRVVRKGANLFIVVPIGQKKLMFNAHRIYAYSQFISYFKNFKLINFSLVRDSQDFINNAKKTDADRQKYGCGCFWFQKL